MDYRQQVTAIFEKHLSEWESNPRCMKSGYDYESTYADDAKSRERGITTFSRESSKG